jgi:hypothetical protein
LPQKAHQFCHQLKQLSLYQRLVHLDLLYTLLY